MEELYVLIGKLIIEYQKTEEYLNLIVYKFERINNSCKSLQYKYKKFLHLESKSMGYKIKNIVQLQIFEEDSNKILNYLCSQRNYVVHELIPNFNFSDNLEILRCKESVKRISSEIEIINKALLKLVLKFNKK